MLETVTSATEVAIRLTDERWERMLSVPHEHLWSSYDAKADVLYINFKKPSIATDSELTHDDVIVRYEDDEVIGLTILHVSTRRDF